MKIKYKIISANKFFTKKLNAFHLYRKSANKKNMIGNLLYLSAGDWRKIFVKKKKRKKINKLRGILCRNRQVITRFDGSYRKFFENSVILLKKKVLPINKKVSGTSILEVTYKKYLLLFNTFY